MMNDEAHLSRRLNILDLMILAPAAALGLAGVRAQMLMARLPAKNRPLDVLYGSVWLGFMLAAALILIRLRKPRPRWRRLGCQPGFLAALAVMLTACLLSLVRLEDFVVIGMAGHGYSLSVARLFHNIGSQLSVYAQHGIAAAWLTLAVAGRWKPEKSWIDRFGIAIGVYWLGLPTLITVASIL